MKQESHQALACGSVKDLYSNIKEREYYLKQIQKCISKPHKNIPGYLRLIHSHGKPQYYWINGNSSTTQYIKKNDIHIAKALAQKTYEQALKQSANKELDAIETFFKSLPKKSCEDIYTNLSPDRKKLLTPYWITDEEFVDNWLSNTSSTAYLPESSNEFYTSKGERVRSKSEVIIADALFKAGIPYKYEMPLEINGTIIHPDFTILNIRLRKEIYWEHFGMMEDIEYIQKTIHKMNLFMTGTHLLGDDFICSWESHNIPLNMNHIQKIIDHYCR